MPKGPRPPQVQLDGQLLSHQSPGTRPVPEVAIVRGNLVHLSYTWPPNLVEPLKHVPQCPPLVLQQPCQHKRIFRRHGHALRGMRLHGVCGVTYEETSAFIPRSPQRQAVDGIELHRGRRVNDLSHCRAPLPSGVL